MERTCERPDSPHGETEIEVEERHECVRGTCRSVEKLAHILVILDTCA